MLMGLCAGLIGSLAFLKKRSLVGEALSHATYPGVILGLVCANLYFPAAVGPAILIGAFCSGLLALYCLGKWEEKWKISSDAALCLCLSLFFGIGILLMSGLQASHPIWFQTIQIYLFGQAATMQDHHIVLYAGLSLGVIAAISLLFVRIKILYFDRNFAYAIGLAPRVLDNTISFLLTLAIVIGMRSVGVVLMSAMIIAPAVAARQWTRSLHFFLVMSACFGLSSCFLGVLASIKVGSAVFPLPTGPMIVIVAVSLSLISLLIAPDRGLFPRLIRIVRFRLLCQQENVLKALYKRQHVHSNLYILWRMRMKKWVEKGELTQTGQEEAEKLIRLHRLWEVYLVHMGQQADRVHPSAEEMEHILTPEIEAELSKLLNHPAYDPHRQPIPGGAL